MADDVELINGMRKTFRDNEDQKFKNSQQEKIERLVNGQDVFLFQPTRTGKFESFAASEASETSDNQSTKTKHWAQETKQSVK